MQFKSEEFTLSGDWDGCVYVHHVNCETHSEICLHVGDVVAFLIEHVCPEEV